MTAEELTLEILERRKILVKEKDYWSCFEVNEREEAGGDLAQAGAGLEVDGGRGRGRRRWRLREMEVEGGGDGMEVKMDMG